MELKFSWVQSIFEIIFHFMGRFIKKTDVEEVPRISLHHLKYTYHTVHLLQSSPSMDIFSKKH